MGITHIKALSKKDLLGGLCHFFMCAREHPNFPMPNNAGLFLLWLLTTSPALVRLIELIYQHVVVEKKKMVV